MRYSFILITKIKVAFLNELRKLFTKEVIISSESEYNTFLRKIVLVAKKYYRNQAKKKNSVFGQEIKLIDTQKSLSEKTAWGGVNLKQVDVEKDFIRKLLVIKKFGFLGFEIHKFKIEKLNILEGECLVIGPDQKKGNIEFIFSRRGDKFKFCPGDEHGVIALTDCIIEETSTNYLDDLIFIFNSKQIILN